MTFTEPLTGRENAVCDLLESGASTAQIAGELFIAPATTRNHIQSIMTKLNAHSRLEAVAIRRGDVSPLARRPPVTALMIIRWLIEHDIVLNDTLLAELCHDFGDQAIAPAPFIPTQRKG